MRSSSRVITFILILSYAWCGFSQSQRDLSYYKAKGYQVFPKYNIAVNLPIELKDVSSQTKQNHDFNYAAMYDESSMEKKAFYQVVINRLPEGYFGSSKEEQSSFREKIYKQMPEGTIEVVFGEDKLTAHVISFMHNGMTGKGIVFIKDGYNYGFTIITNYKLTERFNSLTNNIVFL